MKVIRESGKGVPSDIESELVIFTEGNHICQLTSADRDGSRTVYFDGKEEGKGKLLGVVTPVGLGYMTRSSDIEVGQPLGIEFPNRPKTKSVDILAPIFVIVTCP